MEIYIGGYLFDTVCPLNCPGKEGNIVQGGLCYRCPIFNCVPDKDGFSLIEPIDYRDDWAKEWAAWFNNGYKGYPNLIL